MDPCTIPFAGRGRDRPMYEHHLNVGEDARGACVGPQSAFYSGLKSPERGIIAPLRRTAKKQRLKRSCKGKGSMIVVIPSNRKIETKYIKPLLDIGSRIVVVDDFPGTVCVDYPSISVYNWGHRKDRLGRFDDLYPRRNGASRDFGFYIAWVESDPGEIVVALDDDCELTDVDFPLRVEQALRPGSRSVLAAAQKHINILDMYSNIPSDLFPRGFPYEFRADYKKTYVTGEVCTEAPVFNLGLWTDAFDVNAIDKIEGPDWRHPKAALQIETAVLPKGSLASLCSMNMHFRREFIPAIFQLPMHIPILPHWVIDRYGDIWGGFIAKLLADLNGDVLSIGSPMVAHRKAGNMQRNIWQEHIAHLVNCEMIDLFEAAASSLKPNSYLNLMGNFANNIATLTTDASGLLRPYLDHLAKAIDNWCESLS